MKNKHVGMIIIGVALLMGIMIYLFNRALSEIVSSQCSHGVSCPMWGSIDFHTNLSIALVSFVLVVGVYFYFFVKDEAVLKEIHRIRIVEKEKKAIEKPKLDAGKIIGSLKNEDDKRVLQQILNAEGSVFQSDIVRETGLSKVKITRILDRLEGKGLIERRRRGMTNVIILKQN